MTEIGRVWEFTRYRLDQAINDLTEEQMQWRPYPAAHCTLELLYHIAGAEHYWASRILGRDPEATEYDAMLDRAVMDGFLRDGESPFVGQLSRDGAFEALAYSQAEILPILTAPTEEQLAVQMISPVGDAVVARDGLCRLAQHAGYHTGQIWLMRMDPRFPAASPR